MSAIAAQIDKIYFQLKTNVARRWGGEGKGEGEGGTGLHYPWVGVRGEHSTFYWQRVLCV